MNFICYADDNFRQRQNRLLALAATEFAICAGYTRGQLVLTDFYHDNKAILDTPFGGGCYLWKPWLILQEMLKMEHGDTLFYMDSGQTFRPGIAAFLQRQLQDSDYCLTLGDVRHSDYTSRSCFQLMSCDTPEIHNLTQLCAGFLALKSTPNTIHFCQDWLRWCSKDVLLRSEDNHCGFIAHRWDQSVMTNLAYQYGLTSTRATRSWCQRVAKE